LKINLKKINLFLKEWLLWEAEEVTLLEIIATGYDYWQSQ
jgi:hypothetical protein